MTQSVVHPSRSAQAIGSGDRQRLDPARQRDAALAYDGIRAEQLADPAPQRLRRSDELAIHAIPEAQLTQPVRHALGSLMAEVDALRADRHRLQERLRQAETLADHDPLAEVLNRRAFMREIARAISYAERYETPASLVYFDLNGFKQINDRFGHQAGDVVLRGVAETLRKNVRDSDVVGRVGGDEFAVLLAKAGPEAAARKARSLGQALRAHVVEVGRDRLRVGASIGHTAITAHDSPEAALSRADGAMYADKARARVQSL